MSRQNPIPARKMARAAYLRTQTAVYAVFGNVWKMPKSVRDNYRSIQPADDTNELYMTRREK